jgi:hypothetical protein
MVQCLLLVKLRLVIFTELPITLLLLQLAILLLPEVVAVVVILVRLVAAVAVALVVCKLVRFLLVDLQHTPLLLEVVVAVPQMQAVFLLLRVMVVLLYFLVSHQQEVVEVLEVPILDVLVEAVVVELHGQEYLVVLALLAKVIQEALPLLGVVGLEEVVEKGAVAVKVMPLILHKQVMVGVEVLHLYRVVP